MVNLKAACLLVGELVVVLFTLAYAWFQINFLVNVLKIYLLVVFVHFHAPQVLLLENVPRRTVHFPLYFEWLLFL